MMAPKSDEPKGRLALDRKLESLEIPGLQVEVTPEEADALGAFTEDALSEAEAVASRIDVHDAHAAHSAQDDHGDWG